MPNYQDGKIYTIRNYTDNEMIYVGRTVDTLSRRLAKHRTDCKVGKKISLYSHIVDNDWSNWYIELYEYYPCNERAELDRREGEVIREIGTINKCIAGRTDKEYREDNAEYIKEKTKKYYEDNAEYFKEKTKKWREENADKVKKYREDNPDKIKEKNKNYQKNNADKIKERKKKWRVENPEYIKERDKKYREKYADKINEKVCCDICGAFSSKNNLARHQKTTKCTSALI